MEAPLTYFDIALIFIMLISGLLAMMRGLTREFLFLIILALSGGIAFFGAPSIAPTISQVIEEEWLSLALSLAVIFIAVFVVFSLVGFKMTDRLLNSSIGVLDRTLGLIFGLLRGLVLMTLVWMLYIWLVDTEDQFESVAQARTLPIVDQTANILISILPVNAQEFLTESATGSWLQSYSKNLTEERSKIDTTPAAGSPVAEQPDAEPPGGAPQPEQPGTDATGSSAAPTADAEGYSENEREQLDDLLEDSTTAGE